MTDFNHFTRRAFIGQASTAAGAGILGCRTDRRLEEEARAQSADASIVRAAIHPSIGIARIGNSTLTNGFFIGPEVTVPFPTEAGATRDAQGALKKQAARFRIYGYDAAGRVVRELTAADADIEWTVHVANKKAAWYRFQIAMDFDETKNLSVPRRNADVTGTDRQRLVIDPGPRSISGTDKAGPEYQFDSGTFLDQAVHLGEIRTDGDGRLLFLSATGISASPENRIPYDRNQPDTFNNADGWHDDIADGPVQAVVTLNGSPIPVDPAWVVVAPPNYAPDVIGWRTLYDQIYDVNVERNVEKNLHDPLFELPTSTSFTRDVLPVLSRLTGLQWVNRGFFDVFGAGKAWNFDDLALLAKLSAAPGADDVHAALRLQVLDSFRILNRVEVADRRLWPMLYGDAFADHPQSRHFNLVASPVRALHLKRWAEGHFIADWDPRSQPHRRLEDVPTAEQPAMLDRAALHFCLADAFHPGCELTWPLRHLSLYSAPFRIRHREADAIEPDYGDTLNEKVLQRADGPLTAQGPGDLTRWMALPWQGDTVSCRSGYDRAFDFYVPSFWPARVPNHVLTAETYAFVTNTALPREDRVRAFQARRSWFRIFTEPEVADQILHMVRDYGLMGVIEARPGVVGDPDLPAVMLVETLATTPVIASPTTESKNVDEIIESNLMEDTGWASEAQLSAMMKALKMTP